MTQVAIDLSEELREFVEASVESGRFHNASEMVASALHTLKTDERAKFEALHSEITIGLEQADRGEFVVFDADSIKVEGRSRLSAASGK